MTATILYGTDFGGKKAKEQENITSVLREIGRKAVNEANFGWHEPADLNDAKRSEE